ncbi:hypothetical protein SAMN04490244_1029 [Tranquillimonas rosea]|uniref:Probable membrane transporter protein n=1 Tax=Tranquillimonas rosea TaxID=641238 RepID=A0A1H9QW72_9RHOB|nr:sulfite exporter TauE/SafE family protein [Tranquillimonas rosea]SER64647.1 hypothetical protein SAMN04490244_1029 [Tranquillimonas rosea]
MDYFGIAVAVVALAFGGVLKGATGAGAPLLAIPLLSMLYNVPLAVAVFTVPNLVSNLWQGWHFRHDRPRPVLTWGFAIAGAVGAALGSAILVSFAPEMLLLTVALAVVLYVAFRLARPDWSLGLDLAARIAAPVGFLGGILQGATGISAPVSITFLNATGLERRQFIATIAVFFSAMSFVQIPFLYAFEVLTPTRLALSGLALVPLLAGMPLGAALARRFDKSTFDTIILAILAAIALRLFWSALA